MSAADDDPAATPAPGGVALLIIDAINDLDYPGSQPLIAAAAPMAAQILALRAAADALGVPVIYVNDNFGQCRSERSQIIEHCRRPGAPAAHLVERLAPREADYFVIKPQFSGFHATNLEVLLAKLKARRLVLSGMATDICVLFTAADAHMRGYRLWIPSNAVACEDPQRHRAALQILENAMDARTTPVGDHRLSDFVAGP